MLVNKLELLKSVNVGSYVAENEPNLSDYFVETNLWKKLITDKVDIVRGPKGSGKSALLTELRSSNSLDENVQIVDAEEIKNESVFQKIFSSRAAANISAHELQFLWRIYFCQLIGRVILGKNNDYRMLGESTKKFIDCLFKEGLLSENLVTHTGLLRIFKTGFDYVMKHSKRSVKVNTGTVSGKIVFDVPSEYQQQQGYMYVGDLLQLADDALREIKLTVWICLDRLDSAFEDVPKLENTVLKSLIKQYLDMRDFKNIRLKIFIRSDIWQRITVDGFVEATHIARLEEVKWDTSSILYLIVSRISTSKIIVEDFGKSILIPKVKRNNILNSEDLQKKLFYYVFPLKVDAQPPFNKNVKKADAINWIISRTSDATRIINPRNILYLIDQAKSIEIDKMERGHHMPVDGLMEGKVIQEGLRETSHYQLEQTLFAEYPKLKPKVELLKNSKAEMKLNVIKKKLRVNSKKGILEIVNALITRGFISQANSSGYYEIPFIYKDVLNVKQGKDPLERKVVMSKNRKKENKRTDDPNQLSLF
ncbi:hypothetical protein SRCM101060_02590 [Lactiplantibacillus plantarum]|nr:hypothetical protein SRCM101060_02590 [Lactiplantibacillus plantarum]